MAWALRSDGELKRPLQLCWRAGGIPLAQGLQDVTGHKDVKELRNVRNRSKLCPLVFINCRDIVDRHMALGSQGRDDSLLIGLFLA